jgi:hypothetical protein
VGPQLEQQLKNNLRPADFELFSFLLHPFHSKQSELYHHDRLTAQEQYTNRLPQMMKAQVFI